MTRQPYDASRDPDRRVERAIDAFHEIFGRSPDPENPATELDTWAASPEGQRELKRRGIKNWW